MSSAESIYEEPELEMLDTTEAYLAEIDRIARTNIGALETVGGNILIHIPGVASRTIVTSGPRKGLYREVTDEDPIHYAFIVPQWVLLHILEPDPERELDFDGLVADGEVVVDGDPHLLERFMRLGRTQKNALSIRMM